MRLFRRKPKHEVVIEPEIQEPKVRSINRNPGVSRHPKTKRKHGRQTRVRQS